MNSNIRNIFIGIIIGAIGTCGCFLFIGDVNFKTEIQIGEQLDKNKRDIDVRIEKTIDGDEEVITVIATGNSYVTMDDLEKELERLFSEHNIDKSSSNVKIEKKITN